MVTVVRSRQEPFVDGDSARRTAQMQLDHDRSVHSILVNAAFDPGDLSRGLNLILPRNVVKEVSLSNVFHTRSRESRLVTNADCVRFTTFPVLDAWGIGGWVVGRGFQRCFWVYHS